jgi:hypothetical protein
MVRVYGSLPDFDLRLRFTGNAVGNPQKESAMPQILVVADIAEETANRVVYRERVATSDLESDHFSGQLVERVNWAVHDADAIEKEDHRGAGRVAGTLLGARS